MTHNLDEELWGTAPAQVPAPRRVAQMPDTPWQDPQLMPTLRLLEQYGASHHAEILQALRELHASVQQELHTLRCDVLAALQHGGPCSPSEARPAEQPPQQTDDRSTTPPADLPPVTMDLKAYLRARGCDNATKRAAFVRKAVNMAERQIGGAKGGAAWGPLYATAEIPLLQDCWRPMQACFSWVADFSGKGQESSLDCSTLAALYFALWYRNQRHGEQITTFILSLVPEWAKPDRDNASRAILRHRIEQVCYARQREARQKFGDDARQAALRHEQQVELAGLAITLWNSEVQGKPWVPLFDPAVDEFPEVAAIAEKVD